MEISNNCKELWLDGILDAYIYPVSGSTLPMPFCVAQILSMNNCAFPQSVLHISTEGVPYGDCVADGITAKTTPNPAPSGTVYTIDISANIIAGNENVREALKTMQGNDYYVVLRTAEDKYLLCYTLPNTFSVKAPLSLTSTAPQRTISISLKAMSEFIPITMRS